jgi:hypothetical protein
MADFPPEKTLAPLWETSNTSHLLVAKSFAVIHADLCRILRSPRFSFFRSFQNAIGKI